MNQNNSTRAIENINLKKGQDFNGIPLVSLTATFAKAFGITFNAAPPIEQLNKYINSQIKGNIEKAVIFTPSAIGASLIQSFPDNFQTIKALAPHEVPLLAEYPPIDLNCMNAMYTGLHGDIRKLKRRGSVFSKTLFDKLENKKCALITSDKCKNANLFKNADVEIFTEAYDGEVISKAIQLIKENKHDFFVITNQEYKDLMRLSHPYSKKSLTAMQTHIAAFELLANAAEVYFQDYNTLVGFAPDHGAHRSLLGFGAYGKYIPEDMNIMHFYGVQPKTAAYNDKIK